jgi:PncC family amidohydrolase
MERQLNDLAREAGDELQRCGWRLTTAESCTGGLIGHLLTEIPGSSVYYQGGVIAYANEVKQGVLGVSPATLATDGAVSCACASQMAAGVRRLIGTNVAIATTGIAGPGGGTAEKPVGLVFIAIETPDGSWCERHVFTGDRALNKQQTAVRALERLLEILRGTKVPQ